jgi:hypothetical protein
MALAMSSGCATRATGSRAATWASLSARPSSPSRSHSDVAVVLGETTLTRTRGASSSARPRASASIAALMAPCSTALGTGRTE